MLENNSIRNIPINSTSLGEFSSNIFSSPLSIDSVKELLSVYKNILNTVSKGKKCGNETQSGMGEPEPTDKKTNRNSIPGSN